jgi:hypothetical protein
MTQQLAIDFEWYRCPQGYHFANEDEYLDFRLQRDPPIPGRPVKEDLVRHYDVDLANPKLVAIVPNSKERISCRPFDGHGSLMKSFAQIKTPEELLKFVTRYGPLESESEMGEKIKAGLDAARQFRELLSCKSKGPKKVAAVFKAQVQKRGIAWPPPEKVDMLVGEIHIIPDPSRGIRLRLTTDSLLRAMWWELNQKMAGETIFRICRQCGNPFEAGPGGDARADATFCCPEHSVLFHSLNRPKSLKRRKGA